jgi:hypothetical protein
MIPSDDLRAAKKQLDEVENPNELDDIQREIEGNIAVLQDAAEDMAYRASDTYAMSSGALGDALSYSFGTLEFAEQNILELKKQLEELSDHAERRLEEVNQS